MSRQLLYSLPWKNELEDGRLASAIIFQLLKIFRILKQNIPVILAVVGPFLSVRKLPYLAVKRMFSLNDIQGSKVGHVFFLAQISGSIEGKVLWEELLDCCQKALLTYCP